MSGEGYTISLETKQAVAAVEDIVTSLNKVPAAADKAAKGTSKAFSDVSFKHTSDALKRIQQDFKDLSKIAASDTLLDGLSKPFKQALETLHKFSNSTAKSAYEFAALGKRIADFDPELEKMNSGMRVVIATQMAGIRATEKQQIATANLTASMNLMGQAGAKELAMLKQLHDAKKRNLEEGAKSDKDVQAVNLLTEKLAIQRKATMELETAKTRLEEKQRILNAYNKEGLADIEKLVRKLEIQKRATLEIAVAKDKLKAQEQALRQYEKEGLSTIEATVKRLEMEKKATLDIATAYRDLVLQKKVLTDTNTKTNQKLEAEIERLKLVKAATLEVATTVKRLSEQKRVLEETNKSSVRNLEKEIMALEIAKKASLEAATTKERLVASQVKLNAAMAGDIPALEAEVKRLEISKKVALELATAKEQLAAKQLVLQESMKGDLPALEQAIKKLEIAKKSTLDLAVAEETLAAKRDLLKASMSGNLPAMEQEIKRLEISKKVALEVATAKEQLAAKQRLLQEAMKGDLPAMEAQIQKLEMAKQASAAVATETARLAQQKKVLTDTYTDQNIRISASIEMLNEYRKAQIAAANEESRRIIKHEELKRLSESLASGWAREIAILKERNKGLEQAATFEQRLLNQKALLEQQQAAFVSGAMQEIAALKSEVELRDRAAKAAAAYAFATGNVTKAVYEGMIATEQALKRETNLVTAREHLKTKTQELKDSIAMLQAGEMKDNILMETKEKLLRKEAELLARKDQEIRALMISVARLAAEERKELEVTNSLTNAYGHNNQAIASMRAMLAGVGMTFGSFASSTMLASVALYSLSRAAKDVVSSGMAFEDSMIRVAATASEAGLGTAAYSKDLHDLTEKSLEIAATSRFMAIEVAAAMKELAMAGLSVSEIMTVTRDVMNLAAIGSISFGEAADIATNIMMGFSLGVDQFTHVVDVMAIATVKSNQNISQMGNAMSYVAPVAGAFGVDLEFVAAATMVLANAGIKASRAGTGLRRVITSIFTPTRKGAEAMKAFGISTKEAAEGMEGLEMLETSIPGLFKGAEYSTEALVDKLKKFYMATNGATENLQILMKVVDVRALPAFIRLIQSMDDGDKSLTALAEGFKTVTGAQEDMMRKMREGLTSDWLIFKGALDAVGEALYQLVSEDLSSFVKSLTGPVQLLATNKAALQQFINELKRLGAILLEGAKIFVIWKSAMMAKTLLLGVVGAVTTLTGALVKLVRTAATLGSLAMAATGLGRVLGSLALPVVAFGAAFTGIAGAALVIGGLIAVFTNFGDILSWVTDKTTGLFTAIDQAETAAYKEFEELTKGDGLKKKYEELKAVENAIAGVKDNDEVEKYTNMTLDEQLAIRKELTEEIGRAHEKIVAVSQSTLFNNKKNTEAALQEKKALLELALARLAAAKSIAGASEYSGILAVSDSTSNDYYLTRQQASVEALRNEVKALGMDADKAYREWAIGADTTTESLKRLELQGVSYGSDKRLLEDQINTAQKNLEALKNVFDASATTEPMKTVITPIIQQLEAELPELRDKLKAVEQVIAEVEGAIAARQYRSPVSAQDYLNQMEDMIRGTKEFTAALRENKEVSDANDIYDDMSKIASLSAQIQELADRERNLVASLKEVGEASNADLAANDELKSLHAQLLALQDQLRSLGESGQKYWKMVADADPAIKKAFELEERLIGLSAGFVFGGLNAEKYSAGLRLMAAEILEVDKATGDLTSSSKEALGSMLKTLEAQIKAVKAQIKALEGVDKPGTDIVRALEEQRNKLLALSTAQEYLNGVQSGSIKIEQDLTKESSGLTNAYSALLEVLKMTGQETAALRLERKKEMDAADDSAKSVLRLRNELEDLNKAQEEAIGTSDATQKMMELFGGLDSDMKAKLGDTFVQWFDPGPVIENTETLKDKVGEALVGAKDLGTELVGQIGSEFDVLEERLQQFVASAAEAMKQIQDGGVAAVGAIGQSGAAVATQRNTVSTAANDSTMKGAIGELLTFIRRADSGGRNNRGYDTLVSNSEGSFFPRAEAERLTELTIAQVMQLQRDMISSIDPKLPSSVVGGYQFNQATLRAVVAKAGASANDAFDEAMQDKLALSLLEIEGIKDFMMGNKDVTKMANDIAGRWMALKNSSGKGAFDGVNGNKAYASYEQLVNLLLKAREEFQSGGAVSIDPGSLVEAAKEVAGSVVKTTAAMDGQTAAAATLNKQIEDTAKVTKAANYYTEDTNKLLAEQLKGLPEQAKGLKQIEVLTARREEIIARISKYREFTNTGQQLSDDQQKDLNRALEEEGRIREILNQQTKISLANDQKLIDSGEQLTYSIKKNTDQLRELQLAYDPAAAATLKFRRARADLIALNKEGYLSEEKMTKAIEDHALAVIAAQGPMAEYWVSLKKSIPTAEEFSVGVIDDFRGMLVNALVEGGEVKMDDFVKMVKKKLIEIAVNQLTVNIVGNFTGLTGQLQGAMGGGAQGVAGALGGGQSGGSLVSSLGALYGGVTKLYGGISKLYSAYSSGGWSGIGNTMSGWLSGGSSTASVQAAMTVINSGTATPAQLQAAYSSLKTAGSSMSFGTSLAGMGGGLIGTYLGGKAAQSLWAKEGTENETSIGAGIGGAAGASYGATYGSAFGPVGTFVGAVIGGILGSVGGGGIGSLFGTETRQGSYMSSYSGKGLEDDVSSKSAFGFSIGLRNKTTQGLDAEEFKPIFDGMKQLTEGLAQTYGSALTEDISKYIRANMGDAQFWGKDLTSATKAMFTNILDSAAKLDDGMKIHVGDLLKQAVGDLGGSAEDMANRIQLGIAKVNTVLSTFDTELGKRFEFGKDLEFSTMEAAVDQMQVYIDDFRKNFAVAGETSAQTVGRMLEGAIVFAQASDITTTALDNFTGSAFFNAGGEMMKVLDDMGISVEDFSAQMNAYAATVYTAVEAVNDNYRGMSDGLAESFEAIGVVMPQTREDFRSLVEGLDLTSEAGQRTFVELMGTAEGFNALMDAVDEAQVVFDTEFTSPRDQQQKAVEAAMADLLPIFEEYGQEIPKTREGFVDLLKTLRASGAEGIDTANALLMLSGVLDVVYDAADAAKTNLEAIYQALDPEGFSADQLNTFMAGLVEVGFRANTTGAEILALYHAGTLTGDQIAYLIDNLDMLGELAGDVAATAGDVTETVNTAAPLDAEQMARNRADPFYMGSIERVRETIAEFQRQYADWYTQYQEAVEQGMVDQIALASSRMSDALGAVDYYTELLNKKLAGAGLPNEEWGASDAMRSRLESLVGTYSGAIESYGRAIEEALNDATLSQEVRAGRIAHYEQLIAQAEADMADVTGMLDGLTEVFDGGIYLDALLLTFQALRTGAEALTAEQGDLIAERDRMLEEWNAIRERNMVSDPWGGGLTLDLNSPEVQAWQSRWAELMMELWSGGLGELDRQMDEAMADIRAITDPMFAEFFKAFGLDETVVETSPAIDQVRAALENLQASFTDVGEEIPLTAEALKALYDSGELTVEQMVALAQSLGELTTAYKKLEEMNDWLGLDAAILSFESMREVFGELGVEVPRTKEALKALVESGSLTSEQMLLLAAIFDDMVGVFEQTDPFYEWLNGAQTYEEALATLTTTFADFGVTLPGTKDALEDLINSGALTSEQILTLSYLMEELGIVFSDTIDTTTDKLAEIAGILSDPIYTIATNGMDEFTKALYDLNLKYGQMIGQMLAVTESATAQLTDPYLTGRTWIPDDDKKPDTWGRPGNQGYNPTRTWIPTVSDQDSGLATIRRAFDIELYNLFAQEIINQRKAAVQELMDIENERFELEYAAITDQRDAATKAHELFVEQVNDQKDVLTEAHEAFVDGIEKQRKAASKTYETITEILNDQRDAITDTHDAFVERINEQRDLASEAHDLFVDALNEERDLASDAHDAVLERINAERDALSEAHDLALEQFDAQRDAASELHDANVEALTKEIDLVRSKADALRALDNALLDTIDAMQLQSDEAVAMRRNEAIAIIKSAEITAKTTGFLPGVDSEGKDTPERTALLDALETVKQDNKGLFSSYQDYARDLIATRNMVSGIQSVSGPQATTEEQILKSLESQLELENSSYDSIIKNLDAQIKLENDNYEATSELLQSQLDAENDAYEALIESFDARAEAEAATYEAMIESLDAQLDAEAEIYDALMESIDARISSESDIYDALMESLDAQVETETEHYDGLIEALDAQLEAEGETYDALMESFDEQLSRAQEHHDAIMGKYQGQLDALNKMTAQDVVLNDAQRKQFQELSDRQWAIAVATLGQETASLLISTAIRDASLTMVELLSKIANKETQAAAPIIWVNPAGWGGVGVDGNGNTFNGRTQIGYADGGIATGPLSGYPTTLHGTEAVIPLKSGYIPVRIDQSDLVQEIRAMREELNDANRAIATHTAKTAKRLEYLERWDYDGMPESRETTA